MKPSDRSSGFTLTELMVVLMVVAILTALGAPSFSNLIEKRRLMGAAEAYYSQVMFARNEAVKRSKPIYITVTTNGATDWTFGITDKIGGCDTNLAVAASADASCTIDFDNDATTLDPILYRFTSADYPNVSLAAPDFSTGPAVTCAVGPPALANNETCIDPVRGTARTGTLNFSTTRYALDTQLGTLGRARMCTPAGNKAIPDYTEC